jgi:type IV secretory pathway VirB2 component (pilin)
MDDVDPFGIFDADDMDEDDFEYQIEIEEEPFFADASGMFAALAAAAQRTKSQLRSQTFFIVGIILVFGAPAIMFTPLENTAAAYLVPPLLGVVGYCALRGVMYMRNASNWNDVLLAIGSDDSLVRYGGFRVLGDTFLGDDGEKLVPPLAGKDRLLSGRQVREKEKQQRTLDAIGMSIDAYTAAAHHAKEAGDNKASEEVLHKILDTIASLQLPQFSALLPAVQIEQLEIAICLYLVALDADNEMDVLWKDDIEEAQNGQRLYDFENPASFTPPVPQWLANRDNPYNVGKLLSRAARSLARQGDLGFAYTCYRKAGEWYGQRTLFSEQTSALLDAGFLAATRNDISAAERMLDGCRPHLMHCASQTARRWWVLDAIIADAYDDEERCQLATANAALLQDDKGNAS